MKTQQEIERKAARFFATADLPEHPTVAQLSVALRKMATERTNATANRHMSAAKTIRPDITAWPRGLKEAGRDARALTDDELRLISNRLVFDSPCLAMAALLCSTGLRVGEAMRIKAEDVGDKWLRLVREKSDRVTTIPLNDTAKQALSWLLANGFPSYKRFHKAWRFAVEAVVGNYGPELGPHVLRRTFATALAQRGTPLHVVQRLLGHRSILTTQKYLAVSDSDLAAAVNEPKESK